MIIDEDDYLAHYGTPRKSGRYPWGSGGDEDQQTSTRNQDFYGYVKDMRKQGMSDSQIAEGQGISTTTLRARMSIASNERKAALTSQIVRLRAAGNDKSAIGRRLGIPESTVRSHLKNYEQNKEDVLQATAQKLRQEVAAKRLVDIGSGAENFLGVSATRLNTAAHILKEEGYEVHDTNLPQVTNPGAFTRYKILCPPGTTRKDVFRDRDQIQQLGGPSEDGGLTYKKIQPPMGLSSKRVGIRYGPDGGAKEDGVIHIRPGVEDVSLGKAQYAQVRVLVDGTHYIKGMAIYKDNLPDGVDVVFNTPKKDTGNKLDALKKVESDDPLNLFGATIRDQVTKKDSNGNDKLTSVMNLVNQEGSWQDWSDSISSQMLSKQSPKLIKSQLDMTFEQRQKEFKELSALTNPTVKQKLLETFADETDSASVHLKAAGFKRQGWHAILPVTSLKQSEVYAPGFRDGETVYLVRFPHGGTFEIPELSVNNNNREAKRALGLNPRDAIGIHHTVAEKLSGADFDGDTVLVIPKSSAKLQVKPTLEQLKNFDAKAMYAPYDGMKTIDGGTWNAAKNKVEYGDKPASGQMKQNQMGVVSNLITDMTIRQAPLGDVARAVKHSMVVIDSEKHSLNWKQSALDNGISELALKYQGKKTGGASTLISRAEARTFLPERKARPAALGGPINKETGAKEFVPTNRLRRTKAGDFEIAEVRSKKLAETDDAFTLSSGTPQERLYAEHSNKLKALANQARLERVNTPNLKYAPNAKKVYASEVQSLNDKLELVERNRPLERQAQVIAGAQVHAKRAANPGMDEETVKKIKSQAINEARIRTGAQRLRIEITPLEWEAIQAGAISHGKLDAILDKANLDTVRKLATPKPSRLMTSTKTARAMQMLASGATRSEVADALGVSLSTLDESINGTDDE